MNINHSLSVLFVNYYNDLKEKGITYIPNIEVAKITMVGLYNTFVKDGAIKKIEDLLIEEKQTLVNECREVKTEYTNETLTTQCKILHLIKSINTYS